MTFRQVGGAIGIALLGSLLASAFRDRLDVAGLPGPVAHTARESVVAAHVVAAHSNSAHLAVSADSAYVHGMTVVLLVCGVAALVAALLAALLLPSTPGVRRTEPEETPAVAAPAADARQ